MKTESVICTYTIPVQNITEKKLTVLLDFDDCTIHAKAVAVADTQERWQEELCAVRKMSPHPPPARAYGTVHNTLQCNATQRTMRSVDAAAAPAPPVAVPRAAAEPGRRAWPLLAQAMP